MRVGADTVDVKSCLVQNLAHVGYCAENTDRTGERSRFGKNIVGTARDIIASRSGIVAHRNHHRQPFLLECLYGVPNLLTGVGTTARAVHAQYHRLDIVVFGNFLERFYHIRTHDTTTAVVGDFALGIYHCHFVFGFRRRTHYGCQTIGRKQVIVLGSGI